MAEKKEVKYTLGLDLGVASVGWAVLNLDEKNEPTHIVDTGVIKVQSMEDDKGNLINSKRRDNRGARRTLRRRQHRVNRIKNLIKQEFGFESIEDVYNNSSTNVYELKVNGLKNQLSEAELSKCLIHYCKHRGFKSNRKEGNDSKEDGTVLKAIVENNQRLGDRSISELLLSELDGKNKIKNSDSYKYSFLRSQYELEITALLDKQIELNVIDEQFKENALEIWSSQRAFSDGPGEGSDYAVDFANVFGKCSFETGEYRAPRFAYSQELNTALGKLINLRYKNENDTEYQKLNENQIKDLIAMVEAGKKFTYKVVATYLNKGNLKFKGNRLSRDEYIKCLNKYKELYNVETVDTNSVGFKELLLGKEYEKVLVEMKAHKAVRTVFKNNGGVDLYDNLPVEFKDDIAVGLTFYKTDERIEAYFKGIEGPNTAVVSELDWDLYPTIINEVIPKIKDNTFKESAALSLKVLHKLNKIMITGVQYDEAMKEIGFNHSQLESNVEKKEQLQTISHILEKQYPNEISNPRVIRVLNKCGSLINSVISEYGQPYFINIEVARDINLKRGKRAILENEQLRNLNQNEYIKSLILESYPARGYDSISKYDVEKYKLYQEQEGKCAYTGEMIPEGHLLSSDYEIDHIIPYSKSKLNSFVNKTLVTKKANQEKGDRVPLEYLQAMYPDRVSEYRKQIENNYRMSDKKKEYYLMKSLSDLPEDMTAGSIEDTRFITKYLVKILENNLKFNQEGNEDKKRVISHKAGYVNYFKKACGISNFTHSLESKNYKKQTNLVFDSVEYAAKDLAITMIVTDTINDTTYSSTVKMVKESDKSPEFIKRMNKAIEICHANNHKINYEELKGLNLDKFNNYETDLFDQLSIYFKDDSETLIAVHRVFATLKAEINKQIIKKNRDNHLHHALDAIAVAALTRSTQQKLSEYDKKRDDVLNELKLKGSVTIKYTDYKGNIIEANVTNPNEYFELEPYFIRKFAPLPFENFREEVKAFVYEMDMEKKTNMLSDGKYRSIRPLIPVQTQKLRYGNTENDTRISALHKETVYGELDGQLTKRLSVKDLDAKKLEKIINKDTTNIKVYEACKYWIDAKKPTDFPQLENCRSIKKVKIFDGDASKALNVGRGLVASENIVRIDVYKQENDDRLFFLGQNAMSIAQTKQGKELNQILWYGRDKNYLKILNTEIEKNNFEKIVSMHPGDLINIEKNSGERGLGYVIGFTGGLLEICSPIGDDYDINKTFGMKIGSRLKISSSTIKSIQKKKINIRGVIN